MTQIFMIFLLIPLLALALFLEGTVTTLPLVFVCLFCYGILKKTPAIFSIAFLAGLILDVFTLHRIGASSLFLLVFFYLALLYQKKYEINSYPFVVVSSFVGAWLYLMVFGYGIAIFQAGISCIIAVCLFTILKTTKRLKI